MLFQTGIFLIQMGIQKFHKGSMIGHPGCGLIQLVIFRQFLPVQFHIFQKETCVGADFKISALVICLRQCSQRRFFFCQGR